MNQRTGAVLGCSVRYSYTVIEVCRSGRLLAYPSMFGLYITERKGKETNI